MRFFEVRDPYYALIKAHTKDEAILQYLEHIGDSDDTSLVDSMSEVERDYALVQFCRSESDIDEEFDVHEILHHFQLSENMILLIDGSLL